MVNKHGENGGAVEIMWSNCQQAVLTNLKADMSQDMRRQKQALEQFRCMKRYYDPEQAVNWFEDNIEVAVIVSQVLILKNK